ncbi:MAG: nucleotidyltransferase family protein [Armatimonadota bacterium]
MESSRNPSSSLHSAGRARPRPVPQCHVWGVVLAAGESRRMGTPKQLLPFHGVTMIETVARTLLEADLAGVLVVLGHEAERVATAVRHLPVRCVTNAEYRAGMLTSVQCALRAIPDAEGVCIALVDQPAVPTEVVSKLVNAFCTGEKGIVVPTHQGKRGYPIAIDLRRYRDEIMNLPRDIGLRALLQVHVDDIQEVPVDTDAVLKDIDNPEDYRVNSPG